MVEFALVLPILLFIVLGMFDFGKAFNYWIDETHLANKAARFAAVNRNPGEASGISLQEYIRRAAVSDELRGDYTESESVPPADSLKVCINFLTDTPVVGDPVEVTTKVNYHLIPFIGDQISAVGQVTITGGATMRLEARPTKYSEADNDPSCAPAAAAAQ